MYESTNYQLSASVLVPPVLKSVLFLSPLLSPPLCLYFTVFHPFSPCFPFVKIREIRVFDTSLSRFRDFRSVKKATEERERDIAACLYEVIGAASEANRVG